LLCCSLPWELVCSWCMMGFVGLLSFPF
jgi:hypothetical protein